MTVDKKYKLRVNYGSQDFHVDMTIEEFETELKSGKEFIKFNTLIGWVPFASIRVRPNQIKYYYEEAYE